MGDDGDLCITCEDIIQEIIWPRPVLSENSNSDTEDFTECYAGWLDRMAATTACALCQFLVARFSAVSDPPTETDTTGDCRVLCWLRASGPRSTRSGITLGWNVKIEFQAFLQDGREYDTRTGLMMRLLKDSVDVLVEHPNGYREGDQIFNLALPMERQCRVDFIRDAYSTCQAEHGDHCESTRRVFPRSPHPAPDETHRRYPSHLIDVNENRIVRAGPNSRYVALSYCWTTRPYTVALRSNIDSLRQPNGLDPEHLAPTISDALSATLALGERFLWADALCIVQDDDASKAAEIQHMSSIYRHAAVTIIAATPDPSDGSDPGLPGIRPGSRRVEQAVLEIRGLRLATAPTPLWPAMEASRWRTRGWTYQEYHLSKRELVFTPGRAFFVCARDGFAEDTVRRACVHIGNDGGDDGGSERACCAYRVPVEGEDPDFFDADPMHKVSFYEVMAVEVSARALSYEADALDAITGLVGVMERESGVAFWYGLPVEKLLARFVFWIPSRWVRRRVEGGFPSWSWIGWVGPVFYPMPFGGWFDGRMDDTADELVPSRAISMLVPSELSGSSVIGGRMFSECNLMGLSESALAGSLLRFDAAVATLPVSDFVWGTVLECDGYDSRCHAVFVEEACAGLVVLGREDQLPVEMDLAGRTQADAWLQSAVMSRDYELIALSRTKDWWALWFPIDVNDPANVVNTMSSEGDHDHLPFDVSAWEAEDFELTNVMVTHNINGTAYRIGVGQIHSDAWELSHPSTKTVILG